MAEKRVDPRQQPALQNPAFIAELNKFQHVVQDYKRLDEENKKLKAELEARKGSTGNEQSLKESFELHLRQQQEAMKAEQDKMKEDFEKQIAHLQHEAHRFKRGADNMYAQIKEHEQANKKLRDSLENRTKDFEAREKKLRDQIAALEIKLQDEQKRKINYMSEVGELKKRLLSVANSPAVETTSIRADMDQMDHMDVFSPAAPVVSKPRTEALRVEVPTPPLAKKARPLTYEDRAASLIAQFATFKRELAKKDDWDVGNWQFIKDSSEIGV